MVTRISGRRRRRSRNGRYACSVASTTTWSKLPMGWWLWTPKQSCTLLPIEIAMQDRRREAALLEERAQLFDEGDRAVPAAGAADRHGQVRLALSLVARQQELEQLAQASQELLAFLPREDELPHPRIAPVERAEALDEVRVREESDGEDQVPFERAPVL